jgi:hypothetical protein
MKGARGEDLVEVDVREVGQQGGELGRLGEILLRELLEGAGVPAPPRRGVPPGICVAHLVRDEGHGEPGDLATGQRGRTALEAGVEQDPEQAAEDLEERRRERAAKPQQGRDGRSGMQLAAERVHPGKGPLAPLPFFGHLELERSEGESVDPLEQVIAVAYVSVERHRRRAQRLGQRPHAELALR